MKRFITFFVFCIYLIFSQFAIKAFLTTDIQLLQNNILSITQTQKNVGNIASNITVKNETYVSSIGIETQEKKYGCRRKHTLSQWTVPPIQEKTHGYAYLDTSKKKVWQHIKKIIHIDVNLYKTLAPPDSTKHHFLANYIEIIKNIG